MGKPIDKLEVEIFDWPDRFLVECDGPDVDYKRSYPDQVDYDPFAPYLVDLGEFKCGWCGCTDFRIHCLPSAERGRDSSTSYVQCKHIIAARSYKARHNGGRPKQLPPKLDFQ